MKKSLYDLACKYDYEDLFPEEVLDIIESSRRAANLTCTLSKKAFAGLEDTYSWNLIEDLAAEAACDAEFTHGEFENICNELLKADLILGWYYSDDMGYVVVYEEAASVEIVGNMGEIIIKVKGAS